MLRIRDGGSSGGHNGLKSIEAALGTSQYMRLRMGCGREAQTAGACDHVLKPVFGAGGGAAAGICRPGRQCPKAVY